VLTSHNASLNDLEAVLGLHQHQLGGSFNFRHWLILFHQPIAISQRLGL